MKSLKYLFLVLILILSMAACTDESLSPIFYTLETERSLVEDRGLEDEMTIHEVVKADSYNRYFAAGNTLFTRTDATDSKWSVIDAPVSGALCNTLGVFTPVANEYVYAGFFSIDGDGLGAWYWDQLVTTWFQVSDLNGHLQNDDQIIMIKTIDTNIFISVAIYDDVSKTYKDYDLYYSSNGTAFEEATFNLTIDDTITVPITDIAWDGANTFWVIAGPYLYEDTDGLASLDLTIVSGGPTNPGTKPFGGLLYSTDLYVSTKGGELWSYDGGTWSGPTSVTVDGDDVRFTRFVDVTTVSGDILVGTEGSGYFRLIGGVQTNYERRPEYNISALYNGAINSFFLDTSVAPDALFACTFGAGLWRADYDGGGWLWVQE